MPDTPTPTPTPTPLQPLKSWSHPLGDKSNPLVQLTNLANAMGGYYPLGRNGFWHGGVHFDAGTAGIVGIDQTHVRCIADGEVVAYRIDSQYPLSTLYMAQNTCIQAPFATGFVLVRHRLQAPKIEGSDAAPPELTFYSLYMHLLHWAAYQEDDTLARPAFWPRGAELRVKQTVNDTFVGKPGVRGLNVRCRADHSATHKAPVIDLLPRGTRVTISGEGAYRKLESPRGPASLMEDGALRGYLAVQHLSHIEGDLYRVNANTLNVRAEPNSNPGTPILGRLPRGAEVTVSGEGDFRKLESVNQYVHFESLEGLPEPQAQDSIVVLATPVPIKAGELIGHIGDTQNDGDAHPQQYLHLEVFSGENVEVFIDKSRNWAKDLPDSGRTRLKLAAGTPVVAHQGSIDASHPPASTPDTPTTGTDILLPKSLLNGLRAEYKIRVPASGGAKPRNWYRLDGLLNTADFTKIDGWVCEEVDVTPWVSPWAWEGFALIYNDISNRENLAYSMRAANELDQLQLERYHPLIERMEKGPLQQRLYDLIPDGDANGKMTANELQAGLRLPAVAQSISQLVIHYESEWYYEAQKWDSLDELLGHSGSTPNPNWAAGKERMRKLSWWSEVAASLGLPGNGEVFHFHPVGLVSRFVRQKCQCEAVVKVTRWGDHYGPVHWGRTRLAQVDQWSELLQAGQVSQEEKEIICAMTENEGKIEAVQSYDSEILTAGAMQKTINIHGRGELPAQVDRFRGMFPDLYLSMFEEQGWYLEGDASEIRMYYQNSEWKGGVRLEGQELKQSLREGCSAGTFGHVIVSPPVSSMSCAISSDEYTCLQVMDFVNRLRKSLTVFPNGYGFSAGDLFKSRLGRALVLDEHVNRPGNVANDLKLALDGFFHANPNVSRDVSDWGRIIQPMSKQ
ncbi:hypothetical protein [Pseudomonas sp. 30_B]|uniref:hypothetical protein n=1 Tax=Pseudomonas sp. 30_B TaxID=2813575 RepID=UPI001A9CDE9A|nr:hypothetical protein [Pseudomonas sp. 30_B]